MRALVHSESRKGKPVYGTIGDRRWECEWQELTPSAVKLREADPEAEHDRDRDEATRVSAHATKDEALAAARIEAPRSVYGVAIVQEHELAWFVREDNVGEWEPRGPQFEVDATGEAMEL